MAEASDIQTLYKVDEYVEAWLKVVATDDGWANCFTQREQENLPKARIDVQFTLGAEMPHYFKCPDGKWRNDMWRGSLRIMIVHDRSRQKRARKTKFSDFIGVQKALVKASLGRWMDKITTNNLPYHEIRFFQEQVTTPSIAADDDVDMVILNYNLVVGIRQSVWPGSEYSSGTGETAENIASGLVIPGQQDPHFDDGFGNSVVQLQFRIPGTGTLPNVSDPPDQAFVLKGYQSKLYRIACSAQGVMEVKEYDDGENDGEWLQTDGTPRDTTYNTYGVIVSNPATTKYINRYWSGANGATQNIIEFDFELIVRGGDTVTLAARTIDGKMLGLPGNLSIEGVTDPAQPYAGQWANIIINSIEEVEG